MAAYEYRCKDCGAVETYDFRLGSEQLECGLWACDECDGSLKRIWSFGIAWPMSERGHE